MGVKILHKSLVLLTISLAIALGTGCGSTGGGEGRKDNYATSAAEIYALGEVLGAQDATEGYPSDYARHLESFDSQFIAQFRLGYDKGYAMYQR